MLLNWVEVGGLSVMSTKRVHSNFILDSVLTTATISALNGRLGKGCLMRVCQSAHLVLVNCRLDNQTRLLLWLRATKESGNNRRLFGALFVSRLFSLSLFTLCTLSPRLNLPIEDFAADQPSLSFRISVFNGTCYRAA